jgi:hypothetical protein
MTFPGLFHQPGGVPVETGGEIFKRLAEGYAGELRIRQEKDDFCPGDTDVRIDPGQHAVVFSAKGGDGGGAEVDSPLGASAGFTAARGT